MDNQIAGPIDHIGDLLAFVRVADLKSFTLAAERLNLSRSAVGKSVARLEARLSTRLVHRTTRNVSLSEEGRLFYEHALRILAEVDDAEAALAGRNGQPRGRLRLDLPVSLGRMHVLPILQEFLADWPEVEADVTYSDTFSDLVRDGIDLAIRVGGDDDSRLVRRVLAGHRLIVCASPAYLARRGTPATPDMLAGHDTLVFTHAHLPMPWRFASNGADHEVQVGGRMRMSSTEALRDAALAGFGLVQLGAYLVSPDIRRGALVPVLENFVRPGPPVCAVYPTRRHLSPKVRLFVDAVDRRWRVRAPWD
ncbi:HTH-type transcriptional regulator DmlR [bacterium YEK0313]|nr:HTH-type transcriptional regulator DmlR [bacterium YEK0313]